MEEKRDVIMLRREVGGCIVLLLSQDGDPYEDEYDMSGAGSPRYMAPEVLVCPPQPYNMKVDV